MHLLTSRLTRPVTHWHPLALITLAALAAGGCSKSETAQARAADAPKPIAVATVHKESVRRAVDVVGTLTAVDQVTVSSEADGKVSAILADLGDRVKAGQVLVQLDKREAAIHLRAAAGGACARARPVRRAGSGAPAGHRKDPGRPQAPPRTSRRRRRRYDRAERAVQAHARSRSRRFDDAKAALQAKQAQLRFVAAERQEPARQHPGVGGHDEAGQPPAPRHRDPRAVRRLRRKAARQSGRARQGADAGHGDRAARSAEGHRRNAREDGAVDHRRTPGRAPRGRVSRTAPSTAR